jgi:WD40 repeat protein
VEIVAGGFVATHVQSGSIKNKNGECKFWFVLWRLPNFFFETRGKFLGGEPDDAVNRTARWRAFFGVGALIYIAFAYPGYIGDGQELVRTTGRLWPGVGTILRFDNIWVTSIVYSLVLSVIWLLLFALLIILTTRPRALPALLLHLCWTPATIALFAGQFYLIVKAGEWANTRYGTNPGVVVSFVILGVLLIVGTWLIKVVYLAATDVFRGDDAHPLLAPFVSTGVSWTLAYLALSSGGQSGLPHIIRWLVTLVGPLTVTGINVWACWRIQDRHQGDLLFRDGPPASSDYETVAVQGAHRPSRREFLRLAVAPAIVIGTSPWWTPKALGLASTRSNQVLTILTGTRYSNTLSNGAFVNSVVFSPDGRTLAAGTTDGTVLLWDVTDPGRPTAPALPLDGQDGVGPLAFSPDGRILASGSDGSGTDEGPAVGNIQLWDVTDLASPTPLGPAIITFGVISSLAFSPSGRILISGSDGSYNAPGLGNLQLWNVTDPALPTALGASRPAAHGFNSLAFSPRGRILASGDLAGHVRLWNVADPAHPAVVGRFGIGKHGLVSVAFSPDGRILASGGDAGHVRLWNVADPARPTSIGPPLTIHHSVSSLAFSPDGHTLAASSNGGYKRAFYTSAGLFDSPGYIRLWNVTDPAHPTRPSPYIKAGPGTAGFCSVAFSPDGHTLASGSDGSGSAGAAGRVQLWDVSDPGRPTALGRPLT